MAKRIADSSAEARRLATLFEISQALSGRGELKPSLQRVLEKLERDQGLIRGAVMLLSEDTRDIHIESSLGFGAEGQSARYKLGEGITGRVVESGRPIVVPVVSREPLVLNRAFQRKRPGVPETTFVCVPIVLDRKPVGALAVDLDYDQGRDYEGAQRFFAVVAGMIAQALRVERTIEDERKRLLDENIHLKSELQERYDFSNIIGTSGPMRQAYEQIAQVCQTNTTVLIRGESGTGKELIAHAIHYSSPRSKKPFVKVSVAALPDTLVESELFGYEKGAFTGAQSRKQGRFEMADGGTLFLDEVGELNLATQVKLLRVLQEREFERLGGTETIKVNVRVVAATNKDLESAIAARQFREDLYYRLNVFGIHVPALRERAEDILLLAQTFLDELGPTMGRPAAGISRDAREWLLAYHWPGNVRELRNAIERAILLCDGGLITREHLPAVLGRPELASAHGADGALAADAPLPAGGVDLEDVERSFIERALRTARGNKSKAARLLGLTRAQLYSRLEKYSLSD
ncbi:MAG: sigma-54 interaction domain-containing protein [Myxococcales bacterium]